MKDCRAPNVKRLVAFRARMLFGDDEAMSNGIYPAPQCRANAARAPSQRSVGSARWLVAAGLATALPVVAATPMPVVSAVPYKADSGSAAVQCGTLIDGVAAQAQGLAAIDDLARQLAPRDATHHLVRQHLPARAERRKGKGPRLVLDDHFATKSAKRRLSSRALTTISGAAAGRALAVGREAFAGLRRSWPRES